MFYKDNNDIYETNKGKLFFNRSINITAADKRWIQWISEPDTDCRVIQFLPKLKVWSDDIHSQSQSNEMAVSSWTGFWNSYCRQMIYLVTMTCQIVNSFKLRDRKEVWTSEVWKNYCCFIFTHENKWISDHWWHKEFT